MHKNIINKIAALILKKDLYSLKSMMDSSEVGGAPLLGLKGLVVKSHGSSKSVEIKNSIIQCISFKEQAISEKIGECLAAKENINKQED